MNEAAALPDQNSLRTAQKREYQLRESYLTLPAIKPATETTPEEVSAIDVTLAEDVLSRSAQLLEFYAVLAAYCEAAAELGESREPRDVLAQAQVIARLDVVQVLSEATHSGLLVATPARANHEPAPLPTIETVTRICNAFLAACPIADLERLASAAKQETFGHRCRRAYDTLSSLTRRNTVQVGPAQKVLGRAYSTARMTVAEIAEALSMPTWDVVAFLEEHGYARPLEAIQLSQAEREQTFALLRQARLQGGRAPNDQTVARHVIATQRIEEVDARPWIPRTSRN